MPNDTRQWSGHPAIAGGAWRGKARDEIRSTGYVVDTLKVTSTLSTAGPVRSAASSRQPARSPTCRILPRCLHAARREPLYSVAPALNRSSPDGQLLGNRVGRLNFRNGRAAVGPIHVDPGREQTGRFWASLMR
jgi:hypothetical protein